MEKKRAPYENAIDGLLNRYAGAFRSKSYGAENDTTDVLMDVFGITPELKRENRQYWGRELGMLWERLVTAVCEARCEEYARGNRLCDLFVGRDAIDTKYRVGSGDSGTLRKFRDYANTFVKEGYRPVLLILREDNLPQAITACRHGGWEPLIGADAFGYIAEKTGVDMEAELRRRSFRYNIWEDGPGAPGKQQSLFG